MYDVRAMKAEDFIDDGEIRETLDYADQNKDNVELIDSIIEKAKLRKGLTHREASVLLACEMPDKINEIYDLAEQIKKDFYGNRIVMFAPLYLSNYCVNGCVYCPYHIKNKHIARKKLTQEEVRREVIALQDMGHKRLAIEAGEDPQMNPIEYILECIDTIYSIKHKNGAIRRVNVNIAATTVENYRKLHEAGIGTYILFQETYDKEAYEKEMQKQEAAQTSKKKKQTVKKPAKPLLDNLLGKEGGDTPDLKLSKAKKSRRKELDGQLSLFQI